MQKKKKHTHTSNNSPIRIFQMGYNNNTKQQFRFFFISFLFFFCLFDCVCALMSVIPSMLMCLSVCVNKCECVLGDTLK